MEFNPGKSEFWNENNLKKEIQRIFDICNGCRLCYNLCPSFEVLFKRIDEEDDKLTKSGEALRPQDQLSEVDYIRIVDLCFQCKLCYPKCPYVPPHEFMLDFPRLMLWALIFYNKKRGIKLKDKLMTNPELLGKIGSTFPGLMNWVDTNSLSRFMMEKTIGLHRNKKLPKYYRETFAKWFKKSRPIIENKKRKVALFYTCIVNYNNPQIGKLAVKVLTKNNVIVDCPYQICCGMPHLGVGNLKPAIDKINYNVKYLSEYVNSGYDIVVLQPTCGFMIKQEYEHLADDKESAKFIASKSYDFFEYLFKLKNGGELDIGFKHTPLKAFYHQPCHLKAQNIGVKTRDILKLIPGLELEFMQYCTGHDGTWSMKKEYYDLSLKIGFKLFKKIADAETTFIISDCALAHLHLMQGTNLKVIHPLEILAQAYNLGL